MDGRNLRRLPWGLLLLACGCMNPQVIRTEKPAASGDIVHKASTYEAYANFRSVSGFTPEYSPQQQAEFREEAKLAYKKALEVDPKYLPAQIGLARLLVRCEDYTAARSAYTQALQLAPNDPGLWHECGLCECRQKNWQAAIGSLRKACELSPGDKKLQVTLGYTLGRAGLLRESLSTLVQAEGEAKAHFDMARLLKHMNHNELARQQAALAVRKDASLPGASELLASLESPARPDVQTVSHNEPALDSVANAANTAPTATAAREGTPVRMPPPPVVPIRR